MQGWGVARPRSFINGQPGTKPLVLSCSRCTLRCQIKNQREGRRNSNIEVVPTAYHLQYTNTSFADLLLISTLSKLTNNDLGTKVSDPVGSKFELAGVRSFEG